MWDLRYLVSHPNNLIIFFLVKRVFEIIDNKERSKNNVEQGKSLNQCLLVPLSILWGRESCDIPPFLTRLANLMWGEPIFAFLIWMLLYFANRQLWHACMFIVSAPHIGHLAHPKWAWYLMKLSCHVHMCQSHAHLPHLCHTYYSLSMHAYSNYVLRTAKYQPIIL